MSYQLTISAGDRWHPFFIRAHIQKRSWDTAKLIWLLRKTECFFTQACSPRGHCAFNHVLCVQCARLSRHGETPRYDCLCTQHCMVATWQPVLGPHHTPGAAKDTGLCGRHCKSTAGPKPSCLSSLIGSYFFLQECLCTIRKY